MAAIAPPKGDPCTRNTARCSDATDYEHEMSPCCRGLVILLVKTVATYLDSVGARWWADYGTLLGAVRNPLTTWADYPWLSQEGRTTKGPAPGIIPHDKDADLGVLWADYMKVWRSRLDLIKQGFNISCNYRRGSMKVRISAQNHTNVDLFFWKERGAGVMYRSGYAQVDAYKGREFRKTMLTPFSTVEWEGLKLPAPNNPRAFLEMRYGPGWETPIMANNDGVKR